MHNALCTTHNFYYVQIMCDYVQLCANYVHYVNANVHGASMRVGGLSRAPPAGVVVITHCGWYKLTHLRIKLQSD